MFSANTFLPWLGAAAASLVIALSANKVTGATTNLAVHADTSLFELFPANNLGAVPTLAAGTTASGGRTRALLKFDVAAAIPSGAQVTAARLHLTVVRRPSGGGAGSTFALYRMLQDWGEGTKGSAAMTLGTVASNGEATWVTRFHPFSPWGQPGGQAEFDYAGQPSATVAVDAVGPYVLDGAGLVSDVQLWLDHPEQNHGWMLASQAEAISATARRFGAREDPTAAGVLEVEYELLEVELMNVRLQGGQFQFEFLGTAGRCYAVEVADNLAAPEWSGLTNVCANAEGEVLTVTDQVIPGGRRFYRVSLAPEQ